MILMARNTLPTEIQALKELHAEFNETTSWKVMMKQDELEKSRRKNAEMAAKRQALAKEGPITGTQNVRAIQ